MPAPDPFTVEHFREWCSTLTLDNGKKWELEEFQAQIVADLFAETPEVWVLIPEGNAKTTLMSGIGLYYAAHKERAKIPLAAASRDQAGLLYGQAVEFIVRSNIGGLGGRNQVPKGFRVTEGNRRIEHMQTGSRLEIFAADERTGDGAIFDLALVDELHRHRDLRLYRTWRGKLDKRGGQIVAISTAGEPGGEFEKARTAMLEVGEPERDGKHVRVAGPDSVIHEWALDPNDDAEDIALVKQANPLAWITEEKLERRLRSPSMTPGHWARFVCNIATSPHGAWLPAGAWDACREDGATIPEGAHVFLGVDIGLKSDSTALTAVWEREDGRVVVETAVFTPQGGNELELSFIEDQVRDACRRFQVLEVVYDPWGFKRSAELLLDEGIPMVEVPMTNERIVPASRDLYDAIVSKRIVHNGDPILAAHVAAGVTMETERGWRIGKRKTRAPIDALVALVLAFSRQNAHDGSPVLEWIA